MGVVAAVEGAALVGPARDDFAVAAVVGVAPLARTARLPALERVELGLLSEQRSCSSSERPISLPTMPPTTAPSDGRRDVARRLPT